MASFRYVEQRLLRSEILTLQSAFLFLMKFLVVPAMTLGLLLALLFTAQTHISGQDNAHGMEPCVNESGSSEFEICRWNTAGGGRPVYLIGDSNANHYRTGLNLASRELNSPLITSVRDSCPPLQEIWSTDLFPEGCALNNKLMFGFLSQSEPGVVVMGMSVEGWVQGPNDQRETGALASLQSSIGSLHKAGHRVVVVAPLAPWPDDARVGPAYCGVPFLLSKNCQASFSIAESNPRYLALIDDLKALVRATGATWLDPRPNICSEGICHSRHPNGDWIWEDRSHITPLTSSALAPSLLSSLRDQDLRVD
jgi:hypothetical protein